MADRDLIALTATQPKVRCEYCAGQGEAFGKDGYGVPCGQCDGTGLKADERGSAEPHPPWCSGGCCNPESAQARDAAQAVELTDEEAQAVIREASRGSMIRRDGTTSMRIARAIERAVLAKNGLGGNHGE